MNAEDILKYLEGDLSDSEKLKFEARLNSDQSLQKELAAIKEMKNFAQSKAKENIAIHSSREVYQDYKLKNNTSQKTSNTARNKIKYLIPFSIAAMVLIGAFALGVFNQAPLSNQDLYSEYFTPVDLSIITRSDEDQSLEEKAEHYFNTGKYTTATELLSQLIDIDQNNQQLKLYKAISEMEIGNVNQAKKTFINLSTNPLYQSESEYFLALCHLKENEIEKARSILKSISENSSRATEARTLLNKMSKN